MENIVKQRCVRARTHTHIRTHARTTHRTLTHHIHMHARACTHTRTRAAEGIEIKETILVWKMSVWRLVLKAGLWWWMKEREIKICAAEKLLLVKILLKSNVFKYAKWPSKWLTNESLVSDLMKLNLLLLFNWGFNRFYVGLPGSDVSLGVSAVAMLDSSVNCVCVWSTKKLTMPAYCVAANCNNSQTTPGITMHELPRNRPAVRRGLSLYNSNELTLAAPICVASTSVSAISQTPWNTACRSWHDVPVLFQILPDRLRLIRLFPCGSLGQSISFIFGARVGHFAATPRVT